MSKLLPPSPFFPVNGAIGKVLPPPKKTKTKNTFFETGAQDELITAGTAPSV